jgi:hypothetical protein
VSARENLTFALTGRRNWLLPRLENRHRRIRRGTPAVPGIRHISVRMKKTQQEERRSVFMRSKWFWYQGLALAALCFLSSASAIAAEKVYINGIDANFPPFAYVDKNGNPDGFDVKALDWIAKEMGFKVKHQPMDWDGIIPSLKTKKIDIVASGMSITDERKKQVSFTAPYWKINESWSPEGCETGGGRQSKGTR